MPTFQEYVWAIAAEEVQAVYGPRYKEYQVERAVDAMPASQLVRHMSDYLQQLVSKTEGV